MKDPLFAFFLLLTWNGCALSQTFGLPKAVLLALILNRSASPESRAETLLNTCSE